MEPFEPAITTLDLSRIGILGCRAVIGQQNCWSEAPHQIQAGLKTDFGTAH